MSLESTTRQHFPEFATPDLLRQYHHLVGKNLSEPFGDVPGRRTAHKSASVWCAIVTFALLVVTPLAHSTTIDVRYNNAPGEGVNDMTRVDPLPDNPGTTLGEQRRFAHDHAVKLVERSVWIPDNTPMANMSGAVA